MAITKKVKEWRRAFMYSLILSGQRALGKEISPQHLASNPLTERGLGPLKPFRGSLFAGNAISAVTEGT